MMTLSGRIITETASAVLFDVTEDVCLHLQGLKHWFPKSRVKLPKRKEGTIALRVPNWLYDRKVVISEYAI